eukprot:gene21178-28078_t
MSTLKASASWCATSGGIYGPETVDECALYCITRGSTAPFCYDYNPRNKHCDTIFATTAEGGQFQTMQVDLPTFSAPPRPPPAAFDSSFGLEFGTYTFVFLCPDPAAFMQSRAITWVRDASTALSQFWEVAGFSIIINSDSYTDTAATHTSTLNSHTPPYSRM